MHGYSVLTPSSVGKTAQEAGDALAGLLNELKIPIVDVIGISAAGPTALAFAQRHPGRLRKLVLESAATIRWDDEIKILSRLGFGRVEKATWSLIKLALKIMPSMMIRAMVQQLTTLDVNEVLSRMNKDDLMFVRRMIEAVVRGVAHFSPENQWLTLTTCCTEGRKVHVWIFLTKDPISNELAITFPDKTDESEDEEIFFSDDSSRLGILPDGVAKLVDISQTPAREIDIQKLISAGVTKQISFSPDGRWFALLDEFGRTTLIDLRNTNLEAIQLNTQFYNIDPIGFDKGSHILTGSTTVDNTLIWEMNSLLEYPLSFPLVSNGGSFTTSDGKWLFSLPYDELLESVCPQIGRNLTQSEWQQYGFTEEYRDSCDQFPLVSK